MKMSRYEKIEKLSKELSEMHQAAFWFQTR